MGPSPTMEECSLGENWDDVLFRLPSRGTERGSIQPATRQYILSLPKEPDMAKPKSTHGALPSTWTPKYVHWHYSQRRASWLGFTPLV